MLKILFLTVLTISIFTQNPFVLNDFQVQSDRAKFSFTFEHNNLKHTEYLFDKYEGEDKTDYSEPLRTMSFQINVDNFFANVSFLGKSYTVSDETLKGLEISTKSKFKLFPSIGYTFRATRFSDLTITLGAPIFATRAALKSGIYISKSFEKISYSVGYESYPELFPVPFLHPSHYFASIGFKLNKYVSVFTETKLESSFNANSVSVSGVKYQINKTYSLSAFHHHMSFKKNDDGLESENKFGLKFSIEF